MNFAVLDACVRSLRTGMIDFTSELVAIASENPPGNAYPDCVRAIASRLRALDLPCDVVKYRPAKGRPDDSGAAVVMSSVGTGRRTLYFSGHYDVVPVTTAGQCTPLLKGSSCCGTHAVSVHVIAKPSRVPRTSTGPSMTGRAGRASDSLVVQDHRD